MKRAIADVLRRLKAGLEEIYGARLRGVYVYGSTVRGEAGEESDIDVLIVLDCVENYSAEIQRTSELIGGLSLECGRSISRVFLAEESWREGEGVFVRNVREEAAAV